MATNNIKPIKDKKATAFGELLAELGSTSDSSDAVISKSNRRVKVCAKSLEKFAKTYFPDIFSSDFCELHKEIMESAETIILVKKHKKNYYVRAAPRGHGKSQIISFLLIIWCICYKYKKNILLISDTNDQAKSFIMAIKNELEENELLIQDFGDLTATGSLPWSQDKIVTRNGVHIFGRGASQKLRGSKYNNTRPDLVIIDDLENDENVETEGQRTKLKNWFMKALLPVGTPTTDYIYIGTVLHYESLLHNLLNEANFSIWDRKIYRSIDKFSDSQLWDEWENMLTNELDPDAAEHAYTFYQKHRIEMLTGVKALWESQSEDYYYNLMVLRCQDHAAFNSEYQNEPIDPSTAEFLEEWFDYWYELPEIVEVYGACDPSLGKAKSDRGAIIWAGKDKNGYLYILDVIMGRFPPDRLIDLIILGAIKYQSKLVSVAIETVQFQAMFKEEVCKRGLNAGIQIPVVEYNSKTEKALRLRGLIPKVKNKMIKFHKDHIQLLNEFRRFPKGSDDGMDAVQMICSVAFPAQSGTLVFGKLDMSIPMYNPRLKKGWY